MHTRVWSTRVKGTDQAVVFPAREFCSTSPMPAPRVQTARPPLEELRRVNNNTGAAGAANDGSSTISNNKDASGYGNHSRYSPAPQLMQHATALADMCFKSPVPTNPNSRAPSPVGAAAASRTQPTRHDAPRRRESPRPCALLASPDVGADAGIDTLDCAERPATPRPTLRAIAKTGAQQQAQQQSFATVTSTTGTWATNGGVFPTELPSHDDGPSPVVDASESPAHPPPLRVPAAMARPTVLLDERALDDDDGADGDSCFDGRRGAANHHSDDDDDTDFVDSPLQALLHQDSSAHHSGSTRAVAADAAAPSATSTCAVVDTSSGAADEDIVLPADVPEYARRSQMLIQWVRQRDSGGGGAPVGRFSARLDEHRRLAQRAREEREAADAAAAAAALDPVAAGVAPESGASHLEEVERPSAGSRRQRDDVLDAEEDLVHAAAAAPVPPIPTAPTSQSRVTRPLEALAGDAPAPAPATAQDSDGVALPTLAPGDGLAYTPAARAHVARVVDVLLRACFERDPGRAGAVPLAAFHRVLCAVLDSSCGVLLGHFFRHAGIAVAPDGALTSGSTKVPYLEFISWVLSL